MSKRRSHARYAFDCNDGLQLRGYALYDDRGGWLGDVALDYSPARHCLRLHLISDYGNYAYRWDGAGDKGYAAFLLAAGNEYLTDKLAMGHEEGRVLLMHETSDAIWETFSSDHEGEDADWLGEAREALMRCETEEAFYDWGDEYEFREIFSHFTYGWGGYLPGYSSRDSYGGATSRCGTFGSRHRAAGRCKALQCGRCVLCKRLLPEFKRMLREEQEKGGALNGEREAHDCA